MSWCCISWKISKEINQNDNIFITVETVCLYSSAGDDKMEARDKKWSAPSITPGLLRCPRVPTAITRGEYCDQAWPAQPSTHRLTQLASEWPPLPPHLTTRPIDCQMETNGMMSPAWPRQENIRQTTKQSRFWQSLWSSRWYLPVQVVKEVEET